MPNTFTKETTKRIKEAFKYMKANNLKTYSFIDTSGKEVKLTKISI